MCVWVCASMYQFQCVTKAQNVLQCIHRSTHTCIQCVTKAQCVLRCMFSHLIVKTHTKKHTLCFCTCVCVSVSVSVREFVSVRVFACICAYQKIDEDMRVYVLVSVSVSISVSVFVSVSVCVFLPIALRSVCWGGISFSHTLFFCHAHTHTWRLRNWGKSRWPQTHRYTHKYTHTHTHTHTYTWWSCVEAKHVYIYTSSKYIVLMCVQLRNTFAYGVPTVSRIDWIIRLFCRISALLSILLTKATPYQIYMSDIEPKSRIYSLCLHSL